MKLEKKVDDDDDDDDDYKDNMVVVKVVIKVPWICRAGNDDGYYRQAF